MATNKHQETGFCASLLSSLQPFLSVILPAHKWKHFLPDLDSGLCHICICWHCQLYDTILQVISRVFLRQPQTKVVCFWCGSTLGMRKKTKLCCITVVGDEPNFPVPCVWGVLQRLFEHVGLQPTQENYWVQRGFLRLPGKPGIKEWKTLQLWIKEGPTCLCCIIWIGFQQWNWIFEGIFQ